MSLPMTDAVAQGMPTSWDFDGLSAVGFKGFLPLAGLSPAAIPPEPGVYAVLRPPALGPGFSAKSLGHTLKAYTIAELQHRWVSDAEVVYIGKAAGNKGLRGRLSPFSRMAGNHSGGRSIWQLSDPASLIVAWKPLIDDASAIIEDRLHCAFYLRYGQLPYANISLTRHARALIEAAQQNVAAEGSNRQ